MTLPNITCETNKKYNLTLSQDQLIEVLRKAGYKIDKQIKEVDINVNGEADELTLELTIFWNTYSD